MVSKEIKDWMDGQQMSTKGSQEDSGTDARHTRDLLTSLLGELLANPASLLAMPFVLTAGCRFLGAFAHLLCGVDGVVVGSGKGRVSRGGFGGAGPLESTEGYSMLIPALHYLLVGLRQSEAQQRAARAARAVAVDCEKAIAATPTALDALLQTLEVATSAGVSIGE
ncbi:unnamed protein product, partial [Choristocarpus tenellus]